jgi:hypothetical protein
MNEVRTWLSMPLFGKAYVAHMLMHTLLHQPSCHCIYLCIYVCICIYTAAVRQGSKTSKKKRLSRQLTLTQKNLLRWTLSEYKEEASDRLQKYKKGSQILFLLAHCMYVSMYVTYVCMYLLGVKLLRLCLLLFFKCIYASRMEYMDIMHAPICVCIKYIYDVCMYVCMYICMYVQGWTGESIGD